MTPSPQERVVLVTAGAGGIGAELSRAFQATGFRVHVCDIDAAVLEGFLSANPGITGCMADVGDPEQVTGLFDELRRVHGRLDVLVNNAGIAGPTAPTEAVTTNDWRRTLAVNLDGPFFCARAAIPLLRASPAGCIINIASTAALFGYPNRLPYAVSKWGLVGMTKTLAMELGPEGIRVNAICPGSVSGERIDRVIRRDAEQRGMSEAEIRELYTRQSSMRRFTAPEDVAAMALFLASDAAGMVSGQALAVDGHTEGLFSWSD